jgi:hypothetical protein
MSGERVFKTYPTQAQLASMDRDLEFHPTTNEHPRVLSREQIAHYNREGYITGLDALPAEEVGRVRTFVDELMATVMAKGAGSYSVKHAHMKYGVVWDLIRHPRIVSFVKDLLGDDVIGWGAHFFCKMPGDGKTVAWHQDASYWPLTPSKTLTVWLAIDDADVAALAREGLEVTGRELAKGMAICARGLEELKEATGVILQVAPVLRVHSAHLTPCRVLPKQRAREEGAEPLERGGKLRRVD